FGPSMRPPASRGRDRASRDGHGWTWAADVKMPHNLVRLGGPGHGVVYKAPMSASSPPADRPRGLVRRLLPLAAIVILAGAGYFAVGDGAVSLESLVRYRTTIDTFVATHSFLAVLTYIGFYIVAVALSLPGGAFLTVVGGFLFGVAVGA